MEGVLTIWSTPQGKSPADLSEIGTWPSENFDGSLSSGFRPLETDTFSRQEAILAQCQNPPLVPGNQFPMYWMLMGP